MMNFTIIFIFIALYDYQLFVLLIPQLLDTNKQKKTAFLPLF